MDTLKTKDYFYELPERLIAQHPAQRRDQSRLMVVHREDGIEHRIFSDIVDYLHAGDVLVVNETAVIPARLHGVRETTGAHVELLLLKQTGNDQWETLVRPGRRVKEGEWLSFGEGQLRCKVLSRTDAGGRVVKFVYEGEFYAVLDALGEMPLPPYIHEKAEDPTRYQTVYAKEKGSAAAPTAGLHFTPELLEKIQQKGVILAKVLLHVGLGTFRPVSEDDLTKHVMHAEYYEISARTAEQINQARRRGGRVVAVGTTSVRVLETVAKEDGMLCEQSGWTDIFIYPGIRFKLVDALITNFHLPESTLLMLVSAFAGRERILQAYQTAVEEEYRFFSFGDAMYID